MLSKSLRNQSGFSLLQVLLAVGLTSIVSILMAQVASSLTGIQQRARIETELLDLVEDTRRALIRSDACVLTLNSSGQPILKTEPKFPMQLERIVDENNKTLFAKNQKIANGFLTIREIKAELSLSTPDWKENSLVALDMTIRVDVNGVSFGVDSMVKHFPITVETGPSKELISCNSVERLERIALERTICDSIGGKMIQDQICDLKKSTSVIQAACESMGLSLKGDHCE